MAPARTILDSLRTDDVAIPFWLRVGGVVVATVVAVLVVISAFTAGPPARPGIHPALRGAGLTRAPVTPPPAPGPPPAAGRGPNPSAPVNLPTLPAPLAADDFGDPGKVAAAFAAAYQTWVSPDGPPGSAARVEPYATADLFARFPEPTSWPAPSALAAVDQVTVAASSPQTRVVSVALTQHLLGQDGRPIGAPQASTMSVTVEQQPDGGWLVGRFSLG